MLEKRTTKCPRNDAIVLYMYGELHGEASEEFETHLERCVVCTDEFAAVSSARFSVYEWHKEAFEPLETPHFTIPYEPVQVGDRAPGGVFAGLRELFAFGRWPVTVAAGVVLAIGLGFIAMNLSTGSETQIANVSQNEEPAVPIVRPSAAEPRDEPSPVAVTPVPAAAEKRAVKTIRARHTPKLSVPEPQRKGTTAKAPVLTSFDEEADTSLRLADLFDGIGS